MSAIRHTRESAATPGLGARRDARLATSAARGAWLGSWTLWALGCGTFVYATPLRPAPRPLAPRSAAEVQVFAGEVPSAPHIEVALLEVEQDRGFDARGRPHMIERLREKAAEIGCDAVVITSSASSALLASRWGAELAEPDDHHLRARCLVYWAAPVEPAASRL